MQQREPLPLPKEWGRTAFSQFLQQEGLPVVTGLAVPDLHEVETAPWARLDARGAYLQLLGAEDTNIEARILEHVPDPHRLAVHPFAAPVEAHLAPVRTLHARHHVEQGRLAAPRRTQDAHESIHLEGDSVQYRKPAAPPVREPLHQLADLHPNPHGLTPRSPPAAATRSTVVPAGR